METIVVIIILVVGFIIISFIINYWLWIVIGISVIVSIALIITLIYFFVFKKSNNKKTKKPRIQIMKNIDISIKKDTDNINQNLDLVENKKYIKENDYWYIYNDLQNQLKLNKNSEVENKVIINNNRKIFSINFGDLKKRLEKETIRSILIESFEFYNSEAEKESWNNNEYFINILQKAKINNQCILGFEWHQNNNKRIDITIFGSDKNHKKQIILIELKAWSNDSEKIKWLIKNSGHPIKQSSNYFFAVQKILKEKNMIDINLQSIVYMYNYKKNISYHNDFLLFQNQSISNSDNYKINKFLYTREDTRKLINKLNFQFCNGFDWNIFNNLVENY